MASNQENDPKTGGRVKVEPLPQPTEELSVEEAQKVQGGLKEMKAGLNTPVRDPFGPPPKGQSTNPLIQEE